MTNRYYKQGQSSKIPYILALGIMLLIWIMSKEHEEYVDLSRDYECIIKEANKYDSIVRKTNAKCDSLQSVIDSMKAVPAPIKKKEWKAKKKEETKPIATEPEKGDTL